MPPVSWRRVGVGGNVPLISVIVLVPDIHRSDDVDRFREIIARSLVWLVSAVVAGVVREVTLAGPSGIGLGAIADGVGCRVVEADGEAERVGAAVAGSRDARLLVMRVGYQPDSNLTADLDAFVSRTGPNAVALILAAPETMLERIVPGRARVVGVLFPAQRIGAGGFSQLVRRSRGAARLRARAARVT